MRSFTPIALSFACALAACLLAPGVTGAADWPNWRGPQHNNTSTETGLVDSWSPRGGEGSNLLWKSKALAGRSTPIVFDGRFYTIVRDQPGTQLEGEKVVCADASTGQVLWDHRFNVYLSDVPDTRVGWSSVVADPETGRVYAQGVCGYFCCLDGKSGGVIWERSLHEELGLLSTYGGRTNFPLIYQDTVITSAVVIGWGDSPKWGLLAKPAHRFMGFDKATGELRWLSGTRLIPYDTTYSTPMMTRINGLPMLVFGSGDGAVWGMQPGTGKTVWKAQLSRRGLNVSPVVSPDGRVFTGHSEENTVGNTMGAFVSVDGASTDESGVVEISDDQLLWKNYQVMAGKSSPLLIDGKVYVTTDSAKMLVFDAETGKQLERKALGRVSRGTPVYADGKIYYCSRGGRFYILQPKADGSIDTLFKTSLRGEQADASPIVADGRVYLTTSEHVYCIGSSDDAKASTPKLSDDLDAPLSGSGPLSAGVLGEATPAFGPKHLQLSPYDSLIAPGQSLPLSPRLFTSAGDALGAATTEEVSWSVDGVGVVDASGVYHAPSDAAESCVLVTATVGDLSATARIRIVPPLPWEFDFEDGAEDVPLTWVGGRIRYNLREDDAGNHYLAKPIELPTRPGKPTTKLGTRSRMWMGPSDLSDYTIQADVQMQTGAAGETTSDEPLPEFPVESSNSAVKLPSLGLINSRYTFTLFGPNNEARLYSWCTHDKRTQAAAKMTFKPGLWYTMKLQVEPDRDAGVARVAAKVWPRGEAEPQSWTLQLEDRAPNYEGSPGLFGDAKEAEFYVDNLSVVPN
ncbi:MAG: PQQ-binding-like beta-propeller repeat protein [Planctomycetota bacterium]